MADHERFQCLCQFCAKVFEGDSVKEAVAKVEEHEKDCPKKKAPDAQ